MKIKSKVTLQMVIIIVLLLISTKYAAGNTTAECTVPKLDVVFVLDVSKSIMNKHNFALMKDFVKNITDLININLNDSLAGVVLFGHNASIRFSLTEYPDKNSFQEAVDNIKYNKVRQRGTNTPDVLNLLRIAGQDGRLGLRNDTVKIVVLITDGIPHLKHLKITLEQAAADTEEAATKLHNSGIYDQVYSVRIKTRDDKENVKALNFIANPSSLFYNVTGFDKALFQQLTQNVTSSFCNINVPCPGEGQSFSSDCRPLNATCSNPFPPPICDVPMCSCPIGQVLNEETNKCVNASECRICTVKRQIFKQCGMDPTCATTCANRFGFRDCPEGCNTNGVCECPAGTIIDEDSNECVPSSECPENDCSTHKCPTGSQCKVCNETGLPYCVYSCDIDNGGCDDERLCIEVDAPSCIAGDCCSPVNVTCDVCSIYTCPPGSQCKVCNKTGLPYCVYSCDIDNGGCGEGIQCIEEDIVSCDVGECCSPVRINCEECCPTGSIRKVCNETGLSCCEYSCAVDNGGCDEGSRCVEVTSPSNNASECCSPINITCQSPDDCLTHKCPTGSQCKVCNETDSPYCVYSCAVDNGGCGEGRLCTTVDVPSCKDGECCSPVDVTCPVCEAKLDIVFVLDVSISIGGGRKRNDNLGDQNFANVTTFVNEFIRHVRIGPNDSLVGVILFAYRAVVNISLSNYTRKADLVNAISNLVYSKITNPSHEGTNTPHALDLLRTAGQNGGELKLRDDPSTTKIVIFVTDGRANRRPITRDPNRDMDAIDTEIAAEQLHDSRIYDQIYAVGIQGDNKTINGTQLEAIATDRSLVYNITGFNQQVFEELRENLTRLVCQQQNCSTEGEVYSQRQMQDCIPTCSNPYPACSGMIQEGCHCPHGTVLDETQNKCVPLSKCRCPPECSHDYCNSELVNSSTRPVPCMRESPTSNETECMDPCKLTYCNACYYSNTTLPRPLGCDDCCEDRLCLACVREWAVCVEEKNKRDNKCEGSKEECETEERFKCYEYYGCDNTY